MRLLIITLTMVFISFGSVAKDYKWKCSGILYKVEDPFFGKKKLYFRIEGNWSELCRKKGSQITNDSFNCIADNDKFKSFILDEETETLKILLNNGKKKIFGCIKSK